MIDEALRNYLHEVDINRSKYTALNVDRFLELHQEALTAIYEIGLECIGAADKHEHNEFCNRPCDSDYEEIRNELRGEIQRAWAKACGVAE